MKNNNLIKAALLRLSIVLIGYELCSYDAELDELFISWESLFLMLAIIAKLSLITAISLFSDYTTAYNLVHYQLAWQIEFTQRFIRSIINPRVKNPVLFQRYRNYALPFYCFRLHSRQYTTAILAFS